MPTIPPMGLSDTPSGRIVAQPPTDLPRRLVLEYLSDSRRDLLALHEALIAGDYERARVFGHQMKATGRPYGFPDVTILGGAIEGAAVHQNTPELDRLFRQLQDYLTRVELAGA